jgi:hypothetical protein
MSDEDKRLCNSHCPHWHACHLDYFWRVWGVCVKRTSEDLRETLFDTIEKVRSGAMEPKEANTIAALADRIIKTVEVELDYALACSKLDKQDQGVNPGPLLLTQEK